jgi:hypothetical protein
MAVIVHFIASVLLTGHNVSEGLNSKESIILKYDLSELLLNAVNEQGYLFREACEHVLRARQTQWEVRACEYPVSLQGQGTRIDIVLRAKSPSYPEIFALVECKRAAPEYVIWLFGAPGLPYRGALCSTLGFECNESRSDQPLKVNRLLTSLSFRVNTYQAEWWLEVKQDKKKRISTPQNIESAFEQVLRGVGGFAQEQLEQRQKTRDTFKTFFVPVVITTASLYVASYKPKDVDLSTGTIAKDKILFGAQEQPLEKEAVEWVLVNYGVGENFAPKPIPDNYHGIDPTELQKHKIRSIFVVNSKSIPLFFSKLSLAV